MRNNVIKIFSILIIFIIFLNIFSNNVFADNKGLSGVISSADQFMSDGGSGARNI